jgi:prepilin-type N-terminal cleavage/methylation domain-containing protein
MTTIDRRSTARGVTLVEMLIALTIFGVITTAAFAALQSQGRAFRVGAEKMDLLQNVKYAADAIERNIRTAGSNLPDEQPFLIYADVDVVAFNGDYATNVANDPWAVYFDPDAPIGSVTALTQAQNITIPHSTFSYPDTSYQGTGAFGNSPAETIVFFLDPDSSTSRSDDFALYRQVNRDRPELVARNLMQVGSLPFFEYFRVQQPPSAPLQVVQVPTGSLPLSHSVPIHGSVADTAAFAVIDSVRGLRINFTTNNGREGTDERVRTLTKMIRIPNAGLAVKLSCGDEPILGTTLVAVPDTLVDGSWVARLTWGAATDELAGEQDVARYVLWRRPAASITWGDPYLSVPAGDTTYVYEDLNVQSGVQYLYALAAQDCTPSLSSMVTSAVVAVP